MVKSKILFLLLFIISSVYGQGLNQKVDREFQSAMNFYNSGNYSQAISLFDQIIGENDFNSKTTASFLFKGKSLLAIRQYSDAISTLNQFLNFYADSKYADEARIVITKAYIEQREYNSALEEIDLIIAESESASYLKEAKSIGEKLSANYLNPDDIQGLYNSASSKKVKAYLLLLLAKSYVYNGNTIDGLRIFSEVFRNYPSSPESIEARRLYEAASKNKQITPSSAIIGVMLPLNYSENQLQSRTPVSEILEGIKFAVSRYNRTHGNKIGLLIRDTKRDKDRIKDIADEFEGIPSLKIVIGPVFSDEVIAAGNAFEGSNIKVISPTATDNLLASRNNNIFQANPSFAARGKAMADYLFFVERKNNVAVLNSSLGYSGNLADAFIREYRLLGGDVLAHQVFPPNSIQITQQINQLNVFRDTLEAIYAPISDKNDAPVILSSLVLDSLYVPMYGNQDWFSAKGLETSTTLSNDLKITSDFFIDYKDPGYITLNREFSSQTNMEANRNVLYGYDTAEYILSAINSSNNDTDRINKILNSQKEMKGFHNNISFNDEHVNMYLNILKYQSGLYQLIERYKPVN